MKKTIATTGGCFVALRTNMAADSGLHVFCVWYASNCAVLFVIGVEPAMVVLCFLKKSIVSSFQGVSFSRCVSMVHEAFRLLIMSAAFLVSDVSPGLGIGRQVRGATTTTPTDTTAPCAHQPRSWRAVGSEIRPRMSCRTNVFSKKLDACAKCRSAWHLGTKAHMAPPTAMVVLFAQVQEVPGSPEDTTSSDSVVAIKRVSVWMLVSHVRERDLLDVERTVLHVLLQSFTVGLRLETLAPSPQQLQWTRLRQHVVNHGLRQTPPSRP